MTWEETVKYIRTKTEYKDLVEKSYIEEDLQTNVDRFSSSEEFITTLEIINKYIPECKTIADVGSGNGIAAIAFARKGYCVTAIEPDTSETIGIGAIDKLIKMNNLSNVKIINDIFESSATETEQFDLVYVRQAMHHACDLQIFMKQAFSILKKGGILLTVRDHVVYNEKDKLLFLNSHPLQQFYLGENAYTLKQYLQSMYRAGFTVLRVLKHYDSIINYFPVSKNEYEKMIPEYRQKLYHKITRLNKKVKIIENLIWLLYLFFKGDFPNEKNIPGRLYTFIARK